MNEVRHFRVSSEVTRSLCGSIISHHIISHLNPDYPILSYRELSRKGPNRRIESSRVGWANECLQHVMLASELLEMPFVARLTPIDFTPYVSSFC